MQPSKNESLPRIEPIHSADIWLEIIYAAVKATGEGASL